MNTHTYRIYVENIYMYILIGAAKRLIASKIKVFVSKYMCVYNDI